MRQEYERPSSSRFRVHSAPPIDRLIPVKLMSGGRKLPPLVKFQIDKPTTPDPEKVRMILEQRISQALAGPSHKLKTQQSSTEEIPFLVQRNAVRRGSLQRSAALGSEDMHLVQIDDDELAMLKSINRSQYSSKRQDSDPTSSSSSSRKLTSDTLYKHEYEDNSEEDEEQMEQLKNRRKISMVRQQEEDIEITLAPIEDRRQSGIRNSEERLTGYRHEKMRSSTKSGEMEDDQMSGLVYDMDFDCYYNPQTDKYYRLKSQSKSGEEPSISAFKEIS